MSVSQEPSFTGTTSTSGGGSNDCITNRNVNDPGGDGGVASTDGGGVSAGVSSGGAGGKVGGVPTGRRRDILDKVLASLEPGEWGPAAVLQVNSSRMCCVSMICVMYVCARKIFLHGFLW